MLPGTGATTPAAAEPSLFAAAHPFVGSVHCATFTHDSHPAADRGVLPPEALPAAARLGTAPGPGTAPRSEHPACYQLFGEGPFEPTPGGAPVFLGRVEQLRTLLRLADPSSLQLGSRLPGGGTGVGLAVHKCGPFFVLDGDIYPCALGPPVAHGPAAPSGGEDVCQAAEAAVSNHLQSCAPSVRATEDAEHAHQGEQPLPVVPFMSLEEILFGGRRPSTALASGSKLDLDTEESCSSGAAQAGCIHEDAVPGEGSESSSYPPARPSSSQSLLSPQLVSATHARPSAGCAVTAGPSGSASLSGPGLLRSRSREHLPVPVAAPAVLGPLGGGCPPSMRVTVKNTFVHVEDDDSDYEVSRTHSAPAALQGRHRHKEAVSASSHHAAASEWAIMPSREAQQLPWDLRQLLRITAVPPKTPPQTPPNTSPPMRPVAPQCFPPPLQLPRHALQSSLPLPTQALTQSSPLAQFSGAIRWRFGEFLLLIGCDMLVFRGSQPEDSGESAPHRWRLGRLPGAVGRLDSWLVETLEGAMERTSISEGSHLLPLHGCVAQREGSFDPEPLLEQGRRLLCFLRHHCRREGGTYWLFREVSENGACGECKLFDLSPPDDATLPRGLGALALCLRRDITSPTVALPLAHLCFRLAGPCKGEDRCRLLQKVLTLLEPTRTMPEHRLLYTTAAVSLAILRMAEQPVQEDVQADDGKSTDATPLLTNSCETGRSSVALWYLEECIRLLGGGTNEEEDTANSKAEAPVANVDEAASNIRADVDQTAEMFTTPGEVEQGKATADLAAARREDSLNERSGAAPVAAITGTTDLLVQVHMYYAAVIIKLVRDIAKLISHHSAANTAEAGERRGDDLATCAVVQLVWLCRAQLSLQRMLKRESVALLEHEVLELLADAFGSLTGVDHTHVPWPPDVACDRFRQAIKSIAGGHRQQLAQQSAQLLSQLNALQREVWDDDLIKHPLLLHAIVGEEAALQAWELYGRAARIESSVADVLGSSRARQHSSGNTQSLKISVKQARAGRTLAAAVWMKGKPSEATRLLQQAFDLAGEAGDVQLQWLLLLDAAEIRARHAETLVTSIPLGAYQSAAANKGGDTAVFVFAVEQYAEYCRALALCRAATGESTGSQRLATLELKVGVHLLQFGSMQEHLLDGPTAGSLEVDVEAFGGALAGVGSTSTAWRARLQGRSVADLAVEHLQRALRLFEGNGEETAAVHFQLAEAYALQLEDGALAAAAGAMNGERAAASRRAAALRHLERAATSFEASHHWRDAAAAHRKQAELQAGAWEATSAEGLLAAKAFSALAEAESRFMAEPDESGSISAAVLVLRAGMGDLIRAALQRAEKTGAGSVPCADLRELYRTVLRGESLRADAAHALMVPNSSLATACPEASAGQSHTTKRRRPGRRGR